MDRNQATGLVLIFGILFVYFTFFAPEPSKLPGEQKKEKQKAAAEKVKAKNDTAQISAALAKLGIADSGISLASKPVFLENETTSAVVFTAFLQSLPSHLSRAAMAEAT